MNLSLRIIQQYTRYFDQFDPRLFNLFCAIRSFHEFSDVKQGI